MDRLAEIAAAFGTSKEGLLQESPVAKPPTFQKTGYHGIDDLVLRGGLPRGAKIELAAPPSEGKTSLVLKFAESVIKRGGAVAWADVENVQRYINYSKTYTGYDIPLIHQTDAAGNLVFDGEGDPWMVPDPELFYIFTHTSGEDLRTKSFILLALDIFDLLIIDSISVVDTEKNIGEQVGGKSMHQKYQTAVFWNEFFQSLDNGFEAKRWEEQANKGEGGFITIANPNARKGFTEKGKEKKTVYKTLTNYHKLCDKKATVIFLAHLKDSIDVSMFTKHHVQKKTAGGRGKEFGADIRLILSAANEWSGSGKNKKYKGKKIIMMNEKSRIGAPYGMTTLHLSKDGTLTDDNGQISAEEFFALEKTEGALEVEHRKIVENYNNLISILLAYQKYIKEHPETKIDNETLPFEGTIEEEKPTPSIPIFLTGERTEE